MSKKHEDIVDKDLEDFDDEGGASGEQEGKIGYPSHEELIKQVNSLEDKLMRNQAETDNMRKRYEAEIAKTHKYAIERFAREMVDIADNLERALEQKSEAGDALRTGVELTYKGLLNALEKFSIKPVNPVGQTFDPSVAEAMSMQESADQAPGTVLAVLQKGYMMHDRLLRPALVVVAKAVQKG